MKQYLMFLLAGWFGEKHSRVLPQKDGVITTLVGHKWRGKFYASDMHQKIVDPVAHQNAIKQMLGAQRAATKKEEPRIYVPGRKR